MAYLGMHKLQHVMEIKKSDVVALSRILPQVAAAVPNKEASKLKYRLNRNIDFVGQELPKLEKAERELIEEYTLKDDEGNPVHPDGEDGKPDTTRVTIADIPGLQKAMADFMAATVTLPLQSIPLHWFDGIDAPTDDLFRHCSYLIEEDQP